MRPYLIATIVILAIAAILFVACMARGVQEEARSMYGPRATSTPTAIPTPSMTYLDELREAQRY